MDENDEIITEFLIESLENLENLDRDLVALEVDARDTERLASVFRTIHTIKGTCGFLGFMRLESVTHVGETLLSRLRDGDLILTLDIAEALLSMVDSVRRILASIESTGHEDDVDDSAVVARLTFLSEQPATTETSEDGDGDDDATAVDAAQISDALPPESDAFVDAANVAPGADGTDPLGVPLDAEALEAEALHAYAVEADALAAEALQDEALQHESLDADALEAEVYPADALDMAEVDADGIDAELVDSDRFEVDEFAGERMDDGADMEALAAEAPIVQPPAAVLPAPALAPTPPPAPLPVPAPALVAAETRPVDSRGGRGASASDSTIRVDVGLLDRLMTLVSELVLARNQILQYSDTSPGLAVGCQQLDLLTTELQGGVMKTRMQPIGGIWGKLPRVVRDLAVSCGKKVRLETEGRETELDKTVIEAIKDPLTHIIRNAIDHGIEEPAVRIACGKPAEGLLLMRAYHEGGLVNIELADDGAGINLERVRQKAVERGLLAADQVARLSERDAINLLFLPGFSTAEAVTNVSGRGVGMDVVKTNIERIGGTIDIQSRWGLGTTIKVKIPLTLAIIPGLIIGIDEERYAVPQVNLVELVRLDPGEARTAVERLHDVPVYRLRGKLLPLVHLRAALGLPEASDEDDRALTIVVVSAEDRQFGLIIDSVQATEEIVVKPLSRLLKDTSVFAGATIRGDGRVALILDVLGLARSVHLLAGPAENVFSDGPSANSEAAVGRRSLLLVDCDGGRRVAVPLDAVARLEEMPASLVERSGAWEVVQYRGGIMPLVRLADLVGGGGSDGGDVLSVVVCQVGDRPVGLIVDAVVDIVDQEFATSATGDAIGATAVLSGRITDLLDLEAVLGPIAEDFTVTTGAQQQEVNF